MTSEARPSLRVVPEGPSPDALEAFFDMVDAPAAVCDVDLTVLRANPAFETLCGARGVEGQRAGALFGGGQLTLPEDGRSLQVDVTCRTRQHVTLTLSRRGGTVAVVARGLSPLGDSLAAAGRALLEQARVEGLLLELSRNVALAAGEDELVSTVARGVKQLFPGRDFCVRIIDPASFALTALYADGTLREGRRELFHLRRSMVDKTHLDPAGLRPDRVVISSGELPLLFEGSLRGVAVPLVASGQLFGAINLEYPPGLSADLIADERTLIQLANQVSVAVRNVRLIDELSFMRSYLEELVENANALILVVDRALKVTVFNGALVRLTGWPRKDVLGHPVARLVPEAERLRLLRMVDRTLKGEAAGSQELFLTTADGRQVRVAFSTSVARARGSDAEGVICIGQDLTRMRELEQRIVQAEKLASLGEMAASVVHEINNPMTAVATYADALLKRSLTSPRADPADVDKFRRIVDNSERVLRFTRDLVSYARPAHDKPEEIRLGEVVHRAVGLCEHLVQKHGLSLALELAEVPPFLAVRQNLVQVLVNLVTNACHATPPGGSLRIATSVLDDHAVVQVADTGGGIEPAVVGRVFEPFFTTKPDGKGTGLGLSIVHSIVESHGGSVAVDSEVGRGTTFTVRLPMLKRP